MGEPTGDRHGTDVAPVKAVGRIWFAVTAAVVVVGVVVQLVVTGTTTAGFYPENPERVLNVFAYFTIQSNLLLGATSLVLALGRAPESTLFRTLRLNGVLCIAVTGIVYHLVLAGLDELSGAAAFTDFLLHTATPVLGVVGWLLFGPRGQTDWTVVGWSVVFPLLWLVFTLVRGVPTGFYPYPFVDVDEHGYARVLLNCLLVALLFLALAAGASLLDRRLRTRTTVERL